MASTVSALSRAFFVLVWSGCVTIDTDDGFTAHHDCSLTLRSSGAVSGVVREVDGCSDGATIVSGEGGLSEVEITMGAHPRDSQPFDHVGLAFYELLGEAGEGTAVTVLLAIDQARQWRTPDGACTANYESEACSSEEVEDGVRHIVTAVDCADPAESEIEDPVAIDQLSLTSRCRNRIDPAGR